MQRQLNGLVALDRDGTTPEDINNLVKKILSKGFFPIVASGRPHLTALSGVTEETITEWAQALTPYLNQPGVPFVSLNGAVVGLSDIQGNSQLQLVNPSGINGYNAVTNILDDPELGKAVGGVAISTASGIEVNIFEDSEYYRLLASRFGQSIIKLRNRGDFEAQCGDAFKEAGSYIMIVNPSGTNGIIEDEIISRLPVNLGRFLGSFPKGRVTIDVTGQTDKATSIKYLMGAIGVSDLPVSAVAGDSLFVSQERDGEVGNVHQGNDLSLFRSFSDAQRIYVQKDEEFIRTFFRNLVQFGYTEAEATQIINAEAGSELFNRRIETPDQLPEALDACLEG